MLSASLRFSSSTFISSLLFLSCASSFFYWAAEDSKATAALLPQIIVNEREKDVERWLPSWRSERMGQGMMRRGPLLRGLFFKDLGSGKDDVKCYKDEDAWVDEWPYT